METNKRQNPRITTFLIAQVEILPQKTNVLGRLANLGKEGVLFKTADKAEPGTKVNVKFNLPPIPPGVLVRAEGVVIHSKEGVQMGIQFSSVQGAKENAIAKYIEDKSS